MRRQEPVCPATRNSPPLAASARNTRIRRGQRQPPPFLSPQSVREEPGRLLRLTSEDLPGSTETRRGAARVIDYTKEDFTRDGQRYDVILDNVLNRPPRVNHDNLSALASLLESGAVRVIIDKTYPFDQTAAAVAHVLGHHARGQVAITIP